MGWQGVFRPDSERFHTARIGAGIAKHKWRPSEPEGDVCPRVERADFGRTPGKLCGPGGTCCPAQSRLETVEPEVAEPEAAGPWLDFRPAGT
jgi:hypothetical protein